MKEADTYILRFLQIRAQQMVRGELMRDKKTFTLRLSDGGRIGPLVIGHWSLPLIDWVEVISHTTTYYGDLCQYWNRIMS